MLLMQFLNGLNNIQSVFWIFLSFLLISIHYEKIVASIAFTSGMNSGRAMLYPVSLLCLSIYRIPHTCLEPCLH